MSYKEMFPGIESLPSKEKINIIHFLLSTLNQEEYSYSFVIEEEKVVDADDLEPIDNEDLEIVDGLTRGQRAADIFQRIADRGDFAEITDPVAWQREIREDRPLFGRE
ncbi:MAG: hypothetical protein AAF639_39855 [Chloroflexota bacterium]